MATERSARTTPGVAVIPAHLLQGLEVQTGDVLDVERRGDDIVLSLRRDVIESLVAIQVAFEEAGISEEELQEGGRQIRRELNRALYGLDSET